MSSIHWHAPLTGLLQQRVREVIAAATVADGIAPVGDQVLRELSQDRTRHLLATDGDDAVIGYLNLAPATPDAPAMAELVVCPDARRRGTGAQMIGLAMAAGGSGTRIWAHGNLPPARAVADALGLVVARELRQMRRPLSELPPLQVPPELTLRTYGGPQDDAELLRVNNAAFSWHPEQGGWTADDIAQRRGEGWFDPHGLFLAFDSGDPDRLLGFHWTKVHGDGAGPGEVYVVGVDPAAQGRGLGRILTLAGLHHLGQQLSKRSQAGAVPEVILYVEADNSAAVHTYRKLGFEVAIADIAYAASTSGEL